MASSSSGAVSSVIVVKNVPDSVDTADVASYFNECGPVVDVFRRVIRVEQVVNLVQFETAESAQAAIFELDGGTIGGSIIEVQTASTDMINDVMGTSVKKDSDSRVAHKRKKLDEPDNIDDDMPDSTVLSTSDAATGVTQYARIGLQQMESKMKILTSAWGCCEAKLLSCLPAILEPDKSIIANETSDFRELVSEVDRFIKDTVFDLGITLSELNIQESKANETKGQEEKEDGEISCSGDSPLRYKQNASPSVSRSSRERSSHSSSKEPTRHSLKQDVRADKVASSSKTIIYELPKSITVIQEESLSDPLSPSYPCPIRIGSLTFDSIRQAYHYIKGKYCGLLPKSLSEIKVGTVCYCQMSQNASRILQASWLKKCGTIMYALLNIKCDQSSAFDAAINLFRSGTTFDLRVSPDYELPYCEDEFQTVYVYMMNQFLHDYGVGKLPPMEEVKPILSQHCHIDENNDPWIRKLVIVADSPLSFLAGEHSTDVVQLTPSGCGTVQPVVDALHRFNTSDYNCVLIALGSLLCAMHPDDLGRQFHMLLEGLEQSGFSSVSVFLIGCISCRSNMSAASRINEKLCLTATSSDCNFLSLDGEWDADVELNREGGVALSEAGHQRVLERLATVVPYVNLSCRRIMSTWDRPRYADFIVARGFEILPFETSNALKTALVDFISTHINTGMSTTSKANRVILSPSDVLRCYRVYRSRLSPNQSGPPAIVLEVATPLIKTQILKNASRLKSINLERRRKGLQYVIVVDRI